MHSRTMDAPNQHRTVRIASMLKPDEAEALERMAQRSDRTVSAMARLAIRAYLNNDPKAKAR
jgi:predicted transcriptional regulator